MTNLKQLDKNLDTFDKIISNLTDFSEVAVALKKAQESIVTWTQEIETIKNEVVKYVWLIDKKYEKFIKETVSAINSKNFVLIILMIISLILNGITLIYLFLGE